MKINFKTKVLSLVLSFVMLISVFPLSVFAVGANETPSNNEIEFTQPDSQDDQIVNEIDNPTAEEPITNEEPTDVEGPTVEEPTVTDPTKVAELNGTSYASLAEAIAATKAGDTVKLLADVSNVGSISLPSDVTLDGNGKKITGNSSVYFTAVGGTVKNVVFENIHNENVVNKETCENYGFESKTGTLSAVYSSGLTGTITIEGCTFDNIDWDAIQITTPKKNAVINITDNKFSHTDTETIQLRYIHIECQIQSLAMNYAALKLNITDNRFFNSANQNNIINAICVYYGKTITGSKLSGNYFESGYRVIDTNYTSVSDLSVYYPMRSQPDVDTDDVEMPFVAYCTINNVKTYFENMDNVAKAIKTIDISKKIYLINDIDVTSTIDFSGITYTGTSTSAAVNIYLNGHTITSHNCTALRLGAEQKVSFNLFGGGGTIEAIGANAIENVGESFLSISSGKINLNGDILNSGSGNITLSNTTATFDGKIENTGTGRINISAGTFKNCTLSAQDGSGICITGGVFDVNPEEYLKNDQYTYDVENGIYTARLINDEEALELGYICRNGTNVYFRTIEDLVKEFTETGYLYSMIYILDSVQDIEISNSITTQTIRLYCENGASFSGKIDNNLGSVTIQYGNITLKSYDCNNSLKTLTLGTSSAKVANVVLEGGNIASKIYVNKGNTLIITGGNFTNNTATPLTVKDGATVIIKGGTFAFDPSAYVADGYSVQQKTQDGVTTYSVSKKIESNKITFSFNGTGSKQIEYEYVNANGETVTGTVSSNTTEQFPKGVKVTLKSTALENGRFMFWADKDDRVLSSEETYTFYVSENAEIKAYYFTPSTEKRHVIFSDMNDKRLSEQECDVVDGKITITIPSHLMFSGFTFAGWVDANGNVVTTMESGTFTIDAGEDPIMIYAIYKAKEVVVTVVGGTISPEQEKYTYGQRITVTAEDMVDGKYFAGWYVGDICVSYNKVYYFNATSDMTITAKYEGQAEVTVNPVVNMTMSERIPNADKQAVVMTVRWSMPKGYTVVKAGIIRTTNDVYKDSLNLDAVDGSNVKINSAKITNAEGTYEYTLTLGQYSSKGNVHAVGYVTYIDESGNMNTIYTEVFTSAPNA